MSRAERKRYLASLIYWTLGLVGFVFAAAWARTPAALYAVGEQTERSHLAGVIYGDQRLSQIVEVPREGIAAVQFWLLAHQPSDNGSIVLRVSTPAAPDHDLAQVSLRLSDLPPQPPVSFRLPAFDRTSTPALLLTLEAPELDRAHAISVLGGGNRYGRGTLLVNEAPHVGEDLAFRLFALRTHGDTFLPLTRLASERPGIFGQTWLYVAVVWAVLWAYGWMMINVVRWAVGRRREAMG